MTWLIRLWRAFWNRCPVDGDELIGEARTVCMTCWYAGRPFTHGAPSRRREQMDIRFSDANTFSLGTHYYGTKATCPKHGVVSGDFYCYVTADPEFKTPKICPKCYVEWVAANVTPVTPLPMFPTQESE